MAATAFGIVRRNRIRLAEIEIKLPDLHKDLEGLRIVQITDIHLSAFLSEAELAHVIGMANDTSAHLALMTPTAPKLRQDCARRDACAAAPGGTACLTQDSNN